MMNRRSTLVSSAWMISISFLFLFLPLSSAISADITVEIAKEKGRWGDCQYRHGGSGPYTDWGNTQKVRTFTTCDWVKVLNKKGELSVQCLCGTAGCTCKPITLKRGKFHVPSSNSNWPGGGNRQDGATLYDVYEGIADVRGGAGCGKPEEACYAPQLGVNTPIAQACGEGPEPPGETSWFIADYDSLAQQCRILNHPQSAMSMISRSVSGPDTISIFTVFPGEGLIYDAIGPYPAAVGVFVDVDPEGLPGTWVPVEFEVVNVGVIESFFDVIIENDMGWPMTNTFFNQFLFPGESFIALTEVFIPEGTEAHTVCAVTAIAMAEGDFHEQWAALSVMPDVSVELIPPSARGLHPGETLHFTVVVRNNTADPQEVEGYTGVMLPNGNQYPGNPLMGPITLNLNPYQQFSRGLSNHVPMGAPLGAYVYTGYLDAVLPPEAMDQDGFGFRIDPPPSTSFRASPGW